MNYPRYETYNDSGIEWLGQMPVHWELRRFRFLLKDGYDGLKIGPFGSQIKSDELVNDGYKIYGQENVINKDFTLGYRFLDEDKFKELRVYEIFPEDLLITMMGTSGRCEIVPEGIEQGIMDSHLIRLRTNKKLFVKFAQHLIDQSAYVAYQIQKLGKGSIMHGLNSSIIKSLIFILPSYEEQRSIVDFLDKKTAEIDALIEKKKELINRLEEKRSALITQAVTKGLDDSVPMKASGVEWLGDVPEHWEVQRLKFMTKIQNGRDYKHIESDDDGYPVYGSGGAFRKAYEYLHEGESVLFGRKGTIDKPLYVSGKFWTVDTMFYSEIQDKGCVKYLYYAALTICYQYLATQTALPSITQSDLENYRLCCPSCGEQEIIADFLDKETVKTDNQIEKMKETIKRLEEYRTAIITTAVTGKIKVR